MSKFLALDFETANYGADSACAVGLVLVEDGTIIEEVVRLIRPPTPDFFFTHIHGLTFEHVAGEPFFGEMWPDIAPYFDGIDFLSAHNASFDKKVLRSCCTAYGIAPPATEFFCTVQLARKMWNVRPTKLPNVAHYLGLELDHHDALSDSRTCANIVIAAENDGWHHQHGFENVHARHSTPEDSA